MFFKRRAKKGELIESPLYNPNKPFLTNLKDLIYFPPITAEKFAEKNIHGICKALYTTSVAALNNVNYQLYQIPGVKKYFGQEFLHGFQVKYDYANDSLVYDNLDDTQVSYQYTKEMTKILEMILEPFLRDKGIWILYEGESIKFVDTPTKDKMKKLKIDGYIIWTE